MLSFLESNLQPDFQIYDGDLTNFKLSQRFSLILLPCNTYSTFGSADRHSTLQSVHNHLHEAGVFAVSVPNPNLLIDLPPKSEPQIETVFEHPEEDGVVQISSTWEKDDLSLTFIWHYDHLRSDGSVHRTTTSTRHHLVSVEAYRDEFSRANLSILAEYGDFDYTEFSAESPYLILVAQK